MYLLSVTLARPAPQAPPPGLKLPFVTKHIDSALPILIQLSPLAVQALSNIYTGVLNEKMAWIKCQALVPNPLGLTAANGTGADTKILSGPTTNPLTVKISQNGPLYLNVKKVGGQLEESQEYSIHSLGLTPGLTPGLVLN